MRTTEIRQDNAHTKETQTEQINLGKGLKFTPTPQKPNSKELKEDLAAFTRKVRLLEYF